MIFFAGTDKICISIAEYIKNEPESKIGAFFKKFEKIIFVGYDGIKDEINEYKLSSFCNNYYTIDVMPSLQGEEAIKILIHHFEQGKNDELTKYITPIVIENGVEVDNEKNCN